MALTLSDLLSIVEPEEALSYVLVELGATGFPATAWQDGNPLYTLAYMIAKGLSGLTETVAKIAQGGLLELAERDWLTLLARNAYGLTRRPSAFTVGSVRLTCSGGFGPYSIAPGQLWMVEPTSGRRFNSTNSGSVVLTSSSPVDFLFQAEVAGSGYNLALGTTVALSTPLPGVSVALHDLGTGTWLSTQGVDEESDPSLRTRCRDRWSLIGLERTSDAYSALARDPSNSAGTIPTRVYVNDTNPRGAGTVDVWLASDGGPMSPSDVSQVASYINARKSPSADVQIASAVAAPIAVTAHIYYRSSYTNAVNYANQRLIDYLASIELGGLVSLSEIYAALTQPDGIFDVQITTPTGNTTLSPNQVATPGTITLTGHAS